MNTNNVETFSTNKYDIKLSKTEDILFVISNIIFFILCFFKIITNFQFFILFCYSFLCFNRYYKNKFIIYANIIIEKLKKINYSYYLRLNR